MTHHANTNILATLDLSETDPILKRRFYTISSDEIARMNLTNSFDRIQIIDLIYLAQLKNPKIDLTIGLEYIEKIWGSETAMLAREAEAVPVDISDLSRYEELLVFPSEYLPRSEEHPWIFEVYESIMDLGSGSVRFVVGNYNDEQRLSSSSPNFIGKIITESWAYSVPHHVVGNPRTDAEVYLFYSRQLMLSRKYGGVRYREAVLKGVHGF